MKRWLRRIVVCLVLGAVTTVTVAWGCAVWVELPRSGGTRSVCVLEGYRTLTIAHDAPGARYTMWIWQRVDVGSNDGAPPHRGPLLLGMDAPPSRVVSGGVATAFRRLDARGWPLRAMYHLQGEHGRLHGGIQLGESAQQDQPPVLPLIPAPVEFLADAALYGATWFALLSLPIALWQRLRHEPGTCPRCRYDLRGDLESGCPECGWGRET